MIVWLCVCLRLCFCLCLCLCLWVWWCFFRFAKLLKNSSCSSMVISRKGSIFFIFSISKKRNEKGVYLGWWASGSSISKSLSLSVSVPLISASYWAISRLILHNKNSDQKLSEKIYWMRLSNRQPNRKLPFKIRWYLRLPGEPNLYRLHKLSLGPEPVIYSVISNSTTVGSEFNLNQGRKLTFRGFVLSPIQWWIWMTIVARNIWGRSTQTWKK